MRCKYEKNCTGGTCTRDCKFVRNLMVLYLIVMAIIFSHGMIEMPFIFILLIIVSIIMAIWAIFHYQLQIDDCECHNKWVEFKNRKN